MHNIQILTQSLNTFVQVKIPFELTTFDLFKALLTSTVVAAEVIANRMTKSIFEVPSIHNQLLALWFLTDWFVSRVFH